MSNRPLIVTPDGRAYAQGTPNYANPGLFGAPVGSRFAMVGELSPIPVLSSGYLLGTTTPVTQLPYVGAVNVAGGVNVNYGG